MAKRLPYVLILIVSAASLLVAGCGSPKKSEGGVNAVGNSNNSVIKWPFVLSANHQWAIVNGYAVNGIPQGDHGQVAGSTYALDFALCSSVTAQETCDLSNAWDTAGTDGQPVISPVAGRVLYIDKDSSAKKPGGYDSACRTLGIQMTTSDHSYLVLQLAHIEQLKHYDDSTQLDLKQGDPVRQGEPIGVVSAVSGGGCFGQAHHIHMELYTGSDSKRTPQTFTKPWTISGCAFDEKSTHDGELVPCGAKPIHHTLSGTITEYSLGSVSPSQIIAGPDGRMWFSDTYGSQIGRMTSNGQTSYFPIPRPASPLSSSIVGPYGLALGAHGDVWFAEFNDPRIGRIRADGNIDWFSIPSGHFATLMEPGAGGSSWFAEQGQPTIGKIAADGTITEHPLSHANAQILSLVADPHGTAWFSEWTANSIGQITPDGHVQEYPTPDGTAGQAIAIGPDGNIWFTTEQGLWRMTPAGAQIGSMIPVHAFFGGLVAGPDGNMWAYNSTQVYRIGVSGHVQTFTVPTPDTHSVPLDIVSGPDGGLWFVEPDNNKIGHIT